MKNKYIISIIVVAVLGSLIWLGLSKRSSQPANVSNSFAPSALTADHIFYDFGSVSMAQGKVAHEFILKNDSLNSVKIGQTATSCMCTEVFLESGGDKKGPFGMAGHGWTPSANLTVPAGQTLVAKAVFNPAAHGPTGVGQVEREIYLEESGRDQPIVLSFKAMVTP